MTVTMRSKASLLSRVSTLAILAAAGALGPVQQAQAACTTTFDVPADGTTISGSWTCVEMSAPVVGDVTNNGSVGDPGEGFIPFDASQDISGQLINNGSIFGGYSNVDGQRGALTLTASLGTLVNNGSIIATGGNAVQIGTGGENGGSILDGIFNTNTIASGGRYGIAAIEGTLAGGLTNQADDQSATISGGLAGVFIADTFTSWSGGIGNFGQISGIQAAIQMGDGDGDGGIDFSGGITNNFGGQIDSSEGPAIWISNDVTSFSGGIANYDDIEGGADAIVIQADVFAGGIFNGTSAQIIANSSFGAAIRADTDWTGDFTNDGLIQGGTSLGWGFDFSGSYAGNFANTGVIIGGGGGVRLTDLSLLEGEAGEGARAEFVNNNLIQGGFAGLVISGDTVNANVSNVFGEGEGAPTPTISAPSGTAVYLSALSWDGDVTNAGMISGGNVGMAIVGTSSECVECIYEFAGNITNTAGGTISGGFRGLGIEYQSFTGNILNAGLITGTETGALISTGSFTGDITNGGTITGGGFATGLHIETDGTHTGNIINNNLISALDNALHIEIGTLVVDDDPPSGLIRNTGHIEATDGSTAVLLEIGNGATFENVGGGTILGDVIFGGKSAYQFLGEGGSTSGLEGSLVGEQDCFEDCFNDDFATVQNGSHYFVTRLAAEYGPPESGTASNLASFTVDNGGFALMGARFVEDPNGTGYAFENVDALNVVNGTLYIDNHTILGDDGGENPGLGTFTQGAMGRTQFFLLAPEDGPPVVGEHYGQINADGLVTLGGTISARLDQNSFANTSLNEIEYPDVITGGSLTGDFTTAELFSHDSIWQLNYVIDEATVDLTVTRTDLTHLGDVSGIVASTGDTYDGATADRMNGMGSGSCRLAGEGWCFNRYAQGGSSVMTDATPPDPFEWLRTGVRRVGETAVWGRAVGVWGETEGSPSATLGTTGSDFDIFGGVVGIDHVFTPVLMAGVAVQYTVQDIEFDATPDTVEVDSFEAGAYMSWGDARLYLNANASFIWHDFELTRFVGATPAFGDYDGNTISAYLEAGKFFETFEGWRIQPLVALSYSHLETDAYAETGPAITKFNVFSAEHDSLKGMLGARFGYPIQLESGRRMVPEARIVYAHEFLDDQSVFAGTVQGIGTPVFLPGDEISRETLVLGAGLTAPIAGETTLFVDYDAGLNSDVITHTVSGGFRSRW